jgi:hypothetical protein
MRVVGRGCGNETGLARETCSLDLLHLKGGNEAVLRRGSSPTILPFSSSRPLDLASASCTPFNPEREGKKHLFYFFTSEHLFPGFTRPRFQFKDASPGSKERACRERGGVSEKRGRLLSR